MPITSLFLDAAWIDRADGQYPERFESDVVAKRLFDDILWQ
jgi:hypothetical protein